MQLCVSVWVSGQSRQTVYYLLRITCNISTTCGHNHVMIITYYHIIIKIVTDTPVAIFDMFETKPYAGVFCAVLTWPLPSCTGT